MEHKTTRITQGDIKIWIVSDLIERGIDEKNIINIVFHKRNTLATVYMKSDNSNVYYTLYYVIIKYLKKAVLIEKEEENKNGK